MVNECGDSGGKTRPGGRPATVRSFDARRNCHSKFGLYSMETASQGTRLADGARKQKLNTRLEHLSK